MRRSALAATVLGGLLVAGCSGVPDSGSVHSGRINGSDVGAGLPQVEIVANPPAAHATAKQIVQGFITAMADFENNHAVARQYISSAGAVRWNPNAATQIYETNSLRTIEMSGGTQFEVKANRVAFIDAYGGYHNAGGTIDELYTLVRDSNELRIESVPDGLLLSQIDEQRVFQPLNVYFVSADEKYLVADRQFLAGTQTDLPGVAARAVVRGPESWLDPAVTTAFLPSISIDRVTQSLSTVTVDLNAAAARAPAAAQRMMAAQLIFTLTEIPGVRSVRIVAGGDQVSALSAASTRSDVGTRDPAPGPSAGFYLANSRLKAVGSRAADRLPPFPGASSFAVSADATRVAAIAGSNLLIGAVDRNPTVFLRGSDLSSPAWEPSGGAVWVLDRTGPTLYRVPLSGSPQQVALPRVSGRLSEVVLAPDGVQVALVADTGHLLVGTARREGAQLSVAGLRDLTAAQPGLSGVVDVAWSGRTELTALLGPSHGFGLVVVPVDGSSIRSVTANGTKPLTQIAAAPSAPVLAIAGGRVLELDGFNWNPIASGVAVAYSD